MCAMGLPESGMIGGMICNHCHSAKKPTACIMNFLPLYNLYLYDTSKPKPMPQGWA